MAQTKNNKKDNDQINFKVVIIGLLCIFALIAGGLLLDNYLEKNRDENTESSSNGNNANNNSSNNNNNTSTGTYDEYVKDFTKMYVDEYLDVIKENEVKIAYIGRSTCPACNSFVPILSKVAKDYDLEIIYMDSTKISEEEYQRLDTLFQSIGNQFDYIPMLMITKNNQLLDSSSGVKEETTLIDYLKVFNIIK